MYISPSVVVGFHGCDQSVFDEVIKQGSHLKSSENTYDWLGHGKYFWEGNYQRAKEWANDNCEQPAVIGAFIKLGNCLDLLDAEHIIKLKQTYQILCLEFSELGKSLPQNKAYFNHVSLVRDLDCKVIMRLRQLNDEDIAKELNIDYSADTSKILIQQSPRFIDAVRGMFPEGEELYPDAGFRLKNHIQICVINPNCIVGYFDPVAVDLNYKKV